MIEVESNEADIMLHHIMERHLNRKCKIQHEVSCKLDGLWCEYCKYGCVFSQCIFCHTAKPIVYVEKSMQFDDYNTRIKYLGKARPFNLINLHTKPPFKEALHCHGCFNHNLLYFTYDVADKSLHFMPHIPHCMNRVQTNRNKIF